MALMNRKDLKNCYLNSMYGHAFVSNFAKTRKSIVFLLFHLGLPYIT